MDNAWKQSLASGASGLGIELSGAQVELLATHIDLLLRWNDKLNLTRISSPFEVLGKHVLDSLAVLRVLPLGAQHVLDVGSGAGFPGIPAAIARAGLRVTLVDAVGKKIHFCKNVIALTRLTQCAAIHARLEGDPLGEQIAPADVVVSRAFSSLARFLDMVSPYLASNGSVIAMLSGRDTPEDLRRVATVHGFEVVDSFSFELDRGLGARRVLRLVPRGTAAGEADVS